MKFFLIGGLIERFIMGAICVAITNNRNMNNGFWWGFFLGIIGIIVVAVRPNDFTKDRELFTYADQLERLASLRDRGVLSEEEFELEKIKLMGKRRY